MPWRAERHQMPLPFVAATTAAKVESTVIVTAGIADAVATAAATATTTAPVMLAAAAVGKRSQGRGLRHQKAATAEAAGRATPIGSYRAATANSISISTEELLVPHRWEVSQPLSHRRPSSGTCCQRRGPWAERLHRVHLLRQPRHRPFQYFPFLLILHS